MCSGSEAGSRLRLVDSCISQLKAQGPSETCNESKEEEENPAHRLSLPQLNSRDNLHCTYDVGTSSEGVQKVLEKKEVRDLEDLTIHDLQPISDE